MPGIAVLAVALTRPWCGNKSNSSSDDSGERQPQRRRRESQGTRPARVAGGVPEGQRRHHQLRPGRLRHGRENFKSKAYPFAGSDSYLTDEQMTAAAKACGSDAVEVPAYVSPIAVVFNLSGVDSLNLNAKTIGDIFNGKITKWNDPAIAAAQRRRRPARHHDLPVHRSDDSGTTNNFTEYLNKAGDGSWTDEPSDVWPSQGGEAAEGTSGVMAPRSRAATAPSATPTTARPVASASCRSGRQRVQRRRPRRAPRRCSRSRSPRNPPRTRCSPTTSTAATTESGAYPLMLASYLLACQTYSDANTAAIVKGFLTYIVSSDGQQAAATAAGSAPLPASVSQQATDRGQPDRRQVTRRYDGLAKCGGRGPGSPHLHESTGVQCDRHCSDQGRRAESPARSRASATGSSSASPGWPRSRSWSRSPDVFVFLFDRGLPRSLGSRARVYAAVHRLPVVRRAARLRHDLGGLRRAGDRGAVLDRRRAVHLPLRAAAASPARSPT